jgi:hypothetical protein
MSLEAVRRANLEEGRVYRYCEACEVPVWRFDLKRWAQRQVGDCPYCRRPLVRVEKPAAETWMALSAVHEIFAVSFYAARKVADDGEIVVERRGVERFVRRRDCEKRWKYRAGVVA